MIIKNIAGFSLKISEQAWDSDMFGFKCGYFEISRAGDDRISEYDTLTSAIADIIKHARTDKVKFLTLKADAEEIGVINSVLRNEGTLIDTEITFAKERIIEDAGLSVPEEYSIQKFERYWNNSLYELAGALRYSRFFADRNIDPSVAQKVWRTSIYNNCNGRASYSIVCFHNDRAIGLMNVFDRGEISDIFLIAVSPFHQNKGIGRAMMDVYERSLGFEIKKQIVETQLINYGAQKFYVDKGYRALKAKSIIHVWL